MASLKVMDGPVPLPAQEAQFLRDVEYPCAHYGCTEWPTNLATVENPAGELLFPRFCQKHADEIASNQSQKNKEAAHGA